MKVKIKQNDGTELQVILQGVRYVPGLWCNLFSLTSCITKGFTISSKGAVIELRKGNLSFKIDQQLKSNNGYLVGVKMQILQENGEAYPALLSGTKAKLNQFHH